MLPHSFDQDPCVVAQLSLSIGSPFWAFFYFPFLPGLICFHLVGHIGLHHIWLPAALIYVWCMETLSRWHLPLNPCQLRRTRWPFHLPRLLMIWLRTTICCVRLITAAQLTHSFRRSVKEILHVNHPVPTLMSHLLNLFYPTIHGNSIEMQSECNIILLLQ